MDGVWGQEEITPRGLRWGAPAPTAGCDGSQAAARDREGVRFRPKLEEAGGPDADGEEQDDDASSGSCGHPTVRGERGDGTGVGE